MFMKRDEDMELDSENLVTWFEDVFTMEMSRWQWRTDRNKLYQKPCAKEFQNYCHSSYKQKKQIKNRLQKRFKIKPN